MHTAATSRQSRITHSIPLTPSIRRGPSTRHAQSRRGGRTVSSSIVATLLRHTAQTDKRWAQEARLLNDRYPGFRFTPRPPRLDLIAAWATSTSVIEKTECDN